MAARVILFLALIAAAPSSPDVISASRRERIDRLALDLPSEAVGDDAFSSITALPFWAVGLEDRGPKKKALPGAPTPAGAQRVFDRLIAELPPQQKHDAPHFRLAVLDLPDGPAFTTGGGIVCLARPTVESLLANKKRGEAALAFVLADEIGHVALGHYSRALAEKDAVAAVASFLPFRLPPTLLAEAPGPFSYTAAEREDADRFALHLCRNAGFDLDAVFDSIRLEAARELDEDKGEVQKVSYVEGDSSDALMRLKRLLMERDGLFDDETSYGLFLFDRRSGRLARCGSRQIGPSERPIVLVHGLRGNEWALGTYLMFLRKQAEVADRPLLVFRYPNNESLSRCGQFLTREMRRVVVEPDKAVFVCHSAGGLVFRWYAEVRHGGFDRAVFLAVPHAGTRMAELKGFVDVGRFVLDLPAGFDQAMRNAFGEGDGEIARDLLPGSLFLRQLSREAPPVRRYEVFYGQFFDWRQALELQAVFVVAKSFLEEAVADFVPFPVLQERLTRLVAKAPLPEEITRGDFVVSARSARLPGVSRTTAFAAQHEAFRYDPEIMRRVLEAILR
jgi:pimeloyl-ACP methyl ester carboxylesterase